VARAWSTSSWRIQSTPLRARAERQALESSEPWVTQFEPASRLTRVIQAAVQQHGFRTRFNERGLLWQVNAFERIA